MVTVLDILPVCQILLKLLLLIKSSTVNALQPCFVGVSTPVGHGGGGQLKRLDSLCAHQMRTRTEINKLTLTVERDFLTLRQFLDQFNLIRLILFLHELNRLGSGKSELLQLLTLLDDLLHLCLQRIQIVSGKRLMLKIIVKSSLDARPDCQLCIREQLLHCLSQHMRCGMADRRKSLRVTRGTDLQLTILVNHCPQVNNLAIHLRTACRPRQSFADVKGNVINALALSVLFYRAILQSNLHVFLHSAALYAAFSSFLDNTTHQKVPCNISIARDVSYHERGSTLFASGSTSRSALCHLHLLVTGATGLY